MPPTTPTPSFREFIHHVHYNRRPALAAGILIFAAALLTASLLRPSYRASATLAVLPSPEFTVREAAGSHASNASALAMDQIMMAETEILSSDDLHLATLRMVGPRVLYPDIFLQSSPNVVRRMVHAILAQLLAPWRSEPADPEAAQMERAMRKFRTDLIVLPAKDANVISLSFDASQGAMAATALNSLLTLYAQHRRKLYDDPQTEIVRSEVEAGSRAVIAAEQNLAAFKRNQSISDYPAQRDLLLRRRSMAEQAAQDEGAAAAEHAARLTALTQELAIERPTIGVFTEKDPDTRLQTVNADLEGVRARLASAREKFRDGSRTITTLRAELAAHEAEQFRLSHQSTLSVVREGRNPTIDPLRLDRGREVAALAASRARLEAERHNAHDILLSLMALDAQAATLADLTRRRDSADDIYRTAKRILAERHLSEAEDARRLANVRVIQPAMVPQTPKPTRLLIVIAGSLMAVSTSLAWAIIAFWLHPVFLTADGLAAATALPVLATFKRRSDRQAADMLRF